MLQWPTVKSEGKSSRILAFDLLRGYFVISLILNHLQRFPNGLDWVTMRGQLFVSAAEGFFAVSGIILGIVRGAKLRSQPFSIAAKLLLARGIQLYVWSIGLTLLFTVIGWHFLEAPRLKDGIYPLEGGGGWWELIWRTATLHYTYGWADFLRFYAVYLLVSPAALWLLRSGLWYALVFISVLLWLTVPVFSPVEEPWKWQLLFFSGMTLGFHWQEVSEWWRKLSIDNKEIIIGGVLLSALITFLVNVALVVGPQVLPSEPALIAEQLGAGLSQFFDKSTLAPPRLLLFVIWFSAAFYIIQKYESVIVRFLGWLLLTFGQNSLYVYILHSIFIFALDLIVPSRELALNMLISIGTLAALWLLARKRVLMGIIPR